MKKKITWVIVATIVIVIIGGGLFFLLKKENNSDALKFKEEYESLNNTTREKDGMAYNNITISDDNPVKYINSEDALKILDSKEAIIYVGAAWCPWCRNAVPVLFDVLKDYDVDKIYYLNLDDEKSNYEVQSGKLVKISEGTEGYYKLLDKLEDVLNDYVLTDDNGEKYDTGEKRIYMPFVIGVKDGKIVQSHVGTVTLNENQIKYDNLTDSQYEELYDIYSDLVASVYGKQSCNSNEVCN